MVRKRMGLCVLFLAGIGSSLPVTAQEWERICSEGDTCRVDGTRVLRFGAEKFHYGAGTGTVVCSSATFGDPEPGVQKSCHAYYTADERALYRSVNTKDDRIRTLEEEVLSLKAELEAVIEEVDQRNRQFRRQFRRERR